MSFGNRQPIVAAHLFEETIFENLLGRQAQEKTVRKNPARIRYIGATNITSRQAQLALIIRKKSSERLDYAATNPGRQRMIEGKTFVRGVAFVAAKKLITTIPGEQCVYAILLGQYSAIVGSDR